MGPRYNLSFCACKTEWLAPELLVSMGSSPHLWFLHANSGFWTRVTSLYWYQTSPVALSLQNIVIITRIACLYGTQPSSVVYGCKTSTFWPELQVSMGPRPHLSICACKAAWFAPECQVYMGSSPHLLFCACLTASDLISGFEHT